MQLRVRCQGPIMQCVVCLRSEGTHCMGTLKGVLVEDAVKCCEEGTHCMGTLLVGDAVTH